MTFTLNSLSNFIVNSPITEVEFCGFKSTTLTLQRNGWSLAMEQERDHYSAAIRLRLVMKHEQAKLYAMADNLMVDYGHALSGNPNGLIDFFQANPFQVRYVAPGFKFQVFAERGMPNFQAIDARPSFSETKELDIENMKIFQTLNPGVEILVEQKSVAELLRIIKTKQAPTQAEIRDRVRQEAARKEVRNILEGYDPRQEIKAQIICVA